MTTPPRANIAFPTRYRLGWGRRSELAGELKGASGDAVLVRAASLELNRAEPPR